MKKLFVMAMFILLAASVVTRAQAIENTKEYQEQLIQKHFPQKVQKVLFSIAKDQASKIYPNERDQLVYVHTFLDGYGMALAGFQEKQTVEPKGNPFHVGLNAGQEYYRKALKLKKQRLTLQDFGFEPLTAKGQFVHGPKLSSFYPDGKKEKWWCSFKFKAQEQSKGFFPAGKKTSYRCVFKGYLFPNRGFMVGEDGAHHRDFLVIKILKVEKLNKKHEDI